MKKKSKKGYKLSEETLEKLKVQAEIRKQEEEEANRDIKAEKKAAKKEARLKKKEEKKRKAEEDKISIPKAMETIFCMVYLGFLVICVWNFFSLVKTNTIYLIFGCLATVLLFGDGFHLIPRILDNMKKNGISNREFWLGLGSQISSITMTWFYLLLYFAYRKLFPENLPGRVFDIFLYMTVGLRVFICLLPQNEWYSEDRNMGVSVLRNLIFLVTGVMEIVLFALIGNNGGYGLWKMAIAIGLSFVFYLPVAFGARKHPKLGMLMIPKTLCYVWMLVMGLDLMGKI
ncbi:MAG: hypothetical protein IJ867_01855 [Clostridia bacterium]|nr:hypothetical protein [Clostridia bacterium]